MSRILRRPLFRGGPVSSYGTGIASGLADGGRVGLRYSYPGTVGNAASGTVPPGFTGGEIMEWIRNNPSKEGLNIFDSSMLKSKNPRIYYPMEASQKIASGRGSKTYTPFSTLASKEGEGQTDFEAVYRDMLTSPLDYDFSEVKSQEEEKKKIEDFGNKSIDEIITESQESIEESSDESKSPTMITKEKEFSGEIDSTPSKEALEIAGITEEAGEEPVTKETDLGIKEMADEYFELMGGKKAKIQDAADYLLKYSENVGKTGDWKKAFTDTAGWIADKPSRTEALKNWATKTAIVRKGQMDDLEKRIASTESVADKQILAAQWKQLNSQGQWEKKINTILADKYGGDESKRKQATMDALGQPSTLGAALMAYEKAFGLGMKPNQLTFEDMVSEYYDPAPENWEDNANVSGTYYVPGSMVVVVIEKGKVKNKRDYSQ